MCINLRSKVAAGLALLGLIGCGASEEPNIDASPGDATIATPTTPATPDPGPNRGGVVEPEPTTTPALVESPGPAGDQPVIVEEPSQPSASTGATPDLVEEPAESPEGAGGSTQTPPPQG